MSLQQLLESSVSRGGAPYLVGAVANEKVTLFTGAAGTLAGNHIATTQTIFRIFSMGKAVCATAAAILAERNQLNWSWPVASILPEFEQLRVLEGFTGDQPRTRAPRRGATLLELATHTSGLVYNLWDKNNAKYLEVMEHPSVLSGIKSSLLSPLASDPGTRWHYGLGIDWLGQIIEKIDGRPIDRFCAEEIFEPLKMNATKFSLSAEIVANLGPIYSRQADGSMDAGMIALDPPNNPEFHGMGHALYSTAPDYIRFLQMWLNHGELEGRRLLREDTVIDFLSNKIGEKLLPRMKTTLPMATNDLAFFRGFRKSHSLGFARMEDNIPGGRSRGSQFWAGVLNTHFWFDPAQKVAAVLMTQLTPFLDPQFMDVLADFERAIYAEVLP
ncbi:serine hydrolase domain-containing protein [Rhizobium sp. HT1-10]|uniref:serine hydrolase domain-containing protein n=1 Tax=Rhizobium sp. HT1-10 TaxID=3111638 RepID=UPI003C17C9C3